MPDIENYQVYNDRMRRSMWDKAFFMDKIAGTDMIIDYGCADGSLVRFLSELFPAMRFIGFDIDPVMIASANAQRRENTWFFSTMEEVIEQLARLNVTGDQCAVNFSSVFHEVFHYGFDLSLIRHFLSAIAPQYIVVRDMMYESADGSAAVSAARPGNAAGGAGPVLRGMLRDHRPAPQYGPFPHEIPVRGKLGKRVRGKLFLIYDGRPASGDRSQRTVPPDPFRPLCPAMA